MFESKLEENIQPRENGADHTITRRLLPSSLGPTAYGLGSVFTRNSQDIYILLLKIDRSISEK